MLGRRLILLGVLLAGTELRASVVRVQPSARPRSEPITVSWVLPEGFDESELLVDIEGGPRVRLTGEICGHSPQVAVTLPRLTGRARFVVRAGGEGEDEERGERDVAWSESFTLDEVPTSSVVPVRAASSRPLPGVDMEWWAEAPSRGKEGPGAGLSEPRAVAPIPGEPPPALGSSRHDSAPLLATSILPDPARRGSRRPVSSVSTPGSPPFSGAATPLRN